MRLKFLYFVGLLAFSSSLITGNSFAQTRFDPPKQDTSAQSGQSYNQSLPTNNTSNAPQPIQQQVPISDQQVEQTRAHINGEFTRMNRVVTGGQIQEAWNNAETTSGFYEYKYCGECVYRSVLREHMVTSIQLPEGEIIDKVDVGDRDNFQVEIRGTNKLTVKPYGFGMDTSMLIYGADGRTYPIYMRAEAVHSQNIPDLFIKISGDFTDGEPTIKTTFVQKLEEEIREKVAAEHALEIAEVKAEAQKKAIKEKGSFLDLAKITKDGEAALTKKPGDAPQEIEEPDFVKKIDFDPADVRGFGEYEVRGENWDRDREMPISIYRDDHFTYVYFGENHKNIDQPVGYAVVNDVDELVNTRLHGSTFVIESTTSLIRIVRGKDTYLCISYEGEA